MSENKSLIDINNLSKINSNCSITINQETPESEKSRIENGNKDLELDRKIRFYNYWFALVVTLLIITTSLLMSIFCIDAEMRKLAFGALCTFGASFLAFVLGGKLGAK